MATIDVVINGNARRLAPHGALHRRLVAAAERCGARVHPTNTLDELEAVAHAIAARRTDGVVLAGGDGSHMAGVSALARAFDRRLPPVGLAPGGTVCTVARNLGARGDAGAWGERLIAAACAGTARIEPRTTLRVRDDARGDRVGFIFGAGLVARFFEVYDAAPRPGLPAAARIAARVFAGSFVGSRLARRILEPVPCTLWVDGESRSGRGWSLVLASVVRDVGLHLLATYRAGSDPQRFHVVASGLPPRALGPQMPRVLTGRPLRGEPRVDSLACSLRVRFDGGAPGAYVLDGDLITAGEAHVETGPKLRLLSPP